MEDFYKELQTSSVGILSKKDFMGLRDQLVKKYKLKNVPSIIKVLTNLPELSPVLLSKPSRTISGVAPVAIMTQPFSCPPQAKCTYCPGGPDSFFGSVPKSYTGNEPASMRAARNKFSAYAQVMNRLEQYSLLNHSFGKVELIIMGGTFSALPKVYQQNFITEALQAMNDFSDMFFKNNVFDFNAFKNFFELPADVHDPIRTSRILNKLLQKKVSSLNFEQCRNEVSNVRCVTMVIETRPDCCYEGEINFMLSLGATRVELGVQSLSDEILKKVKRGHDVNSSIAATKLVKDSFLKACHQIMPGLYEGVDESTSMIKELFSNQDFRPDALKIYPCMVLPGTELHNEYLSNKFTPLTTEEAAEVLVEAKKFVPKYCRIMRIQRDIPTHVTIDGVGMTNFRQYVHALMKKRGITCSCIRCREPRSRLISWDHVKLYRLDYKSSDGDEVFLSFEDVKNDILLGFLRLRCPSKPFRSEIKANTLGVRELHVYGQATQFGEVGKIQHHGLGRRLMDAAETIALDEFDAKKLIVISGIGVRHYYYKLGYSPDGVYVSKLLK
ncbi:MAG: tRNA uridine(34) 5-carboxymethylaminomethyl modification radical SAM/GNAT enzyme Elp3 [Nanoarchaeota archaeon]